MKFLIEGVRYKSMQDKFVFDWNTDLKDDLLDLTIQTYNKRASIKNGNEVYYAYKLNKPINKDLRDAIKYINTSKLIVNDIDLLLNKAIIRFNTYVQNLNTFDIIITPSSTSKILDLLSNKIAAKAGPNTMLVKDAFVKNTLDNITYDKVKLNKLSEKDRETILKILDKAFSKKDYKLKEIAPRYRKFILNFLSFKTDLDRKVFNRILQGNVLLIDDILTEGTTFKNMNNLLLTRGANKVIGFVLLTNK